MAAPAAFGAYTYSGYDAQVGRFNGNGYTGSQSKAAADASAEIVSNQVGGNYNVDACLVSASANICLLSPWVRVGDNATYQVSNAAGAGAQVRIRFSNDLTTRVNVQVTGKWRAR